MKLLLSILVLFITLIPVQSQHIAQIFTADTTKSTETIYYTAVKPVILYQGIATFEFTASHDSMTAILQGRNGGIVWWDIDTANVGGSEATNYKLTDILPEYVFYRLKMAGKLEDTCYISNGRFTFKY